MLKIPATDLGITYQMCGSCGATAGLSMPIPHKANCAGVRIPSALPTDSQARKNTPVYSGLIKYFPLAIAEVARLSKAGNDKHNPGQPLHWSRDKSNDHEDCMARHLLELGTVDPDDGFLHDVKLAWRALANLQLRLENFTRSEMQKVD